MEKILKYDVVIIGTGLAGIFTALNLNDDINIALVAKEGIVSGSSILAQGGISAEIEDIKGKIDSHYNDTLSAGNFLNNKLATRILVEEAHANIDKLISFGVEFDRTENGELLRTLEGGHSSNRILHAGGDATGKKIMEGLRHSLKNKQNITVYEENMVFELITHKSKVIGVSSINHKNEIIHFFSKKVVIATGGIGGIYKNSTNDKNMVGDGIAIAIKAKAKISNMEFVQFHPTGFYEEEKRGQRFLISEALRGEGAILRNIEKVAFMQKYYPSKDLAPRDKVSQSIYREMFDTWSDHVYLDITHKSREFLEKRFPTIFNFCLIKGIDISKDLIPVSPIEHFLCGGIEVDTYGKTSLTNLYAVGECSCTGVHGSNRLASNSLLECVVFSNRIAADINNQNLSKVKLLEINIGKSAEYKPYNFKSIRVEIRDIMDKYVSIVRTKEGLLIAKKIISRHYKNLKKIRVNSRYYYETLNMATVALSVINQALLRKESIGCHYRID
ncbi:MAG: L-aspartate oxidase [Anaeroplasmataceae bacterium]